jgi:hypothetical protein
MIAHTLVFLSTAVVNRELFYVPYAAHQNELAPNKKAFRMLCSKGLAGFGNRRIFLDFLSL